MLEVVKIHNNGTIGLERDNRYCYALVVNRVCDNVVVVPITDGKNEVSREKINFFCGEEETVEGKLDFFRMHSIDASKIKEEVGKVKGPFFDMAELGYIRHIGKLIKREDDVEIILLHLLKTSGIETDTQTFYKMCKQIHKFAQCCQVVKKDNKEQEELFFKEGDICLINFDLNSEGAEIQKKRFGVITEYSENIIQCVPISSKINEGYLTLMEDNVWYPKYNTTIVNGSVYPEQVKSFDSIRVIKKIGHLKHNYRIELYCEIHEKNFLPKGTPKGRIKNKTRKEAYERKVISFIKGIIADCDEQERKRIYKSKDIFIRKLWECMDQKA